MIALDYQPHPANCTQPHCNTMEPESGRIVAPLRGCRLCQNCGRSNGNRAYACKWCHLQLPRKGQSIKDRKRRWECIDVSDLVHEGVVPSAKRTFSVRVRKAGPDYRTFVSQQPTGILKCYAKDCGIVQDTRERSGHNGQSTCEHVKCVQQQHMSVGPPTSIETTLSLDVDLLTTLPIPANVAHELKCMVEKTPSLITRVSEESFAIRVAEITQDQPLGIVHVRFSKPAHAQSQSSGSTQAFYCPCHTFTQFSRRSSGGPTTARLSRRCSHFYICLWAFASDTSLSKEFHYLLQSLKGMLVISAIHVTQKPCIESLYSLSNLCLRR